MSMTTRNTHRDMTPRIGRTVPSDDEDENEIADEKDGEENSKSTDSRISRRGPRTVAPATGGITLNRGAKK